MGDWADGVVKGAVVGGGPSTGRDARSGPVMVGVIVGLVLAFPLVALTVSRCAPG
jgi:hypothetical protein